MALAPFEDFDIEAIELWNKTDVQINQIDLGCCKQTVEPVFGIINSVLGFRQFSLCGLKKVTGE